MKLLPETPCAVPGDGRRNSPTTGTVTGEGETPSHPAKDNSGPSGTAKSGATGDEETPSHPVLGRLQGLWSRRKLDATRCGGNPKPPGNGHALGPSGLGEARRQRYWADSRASGPGERPVPPAKGRLQFIRRRGNPEPRKAKKALRHPAKGKLGPFGSGETPGCFGGKKALCHRSRNYLALAGLGATPAGWQRGRPWPRHGGDPEPPVIWSRPVIRVRSWPW